MNTGAEGVETAIKLCRKWAYQKKGLDAASAKIIVCEGNFHGRTTTIISFSSDEFPAIPFEFSLSRCDDPPAKLFMSSLSSPNLLLPSIISCHSTIQAAER